MTKVFVLGVAVLALGGCQQPNMVVQQNPGPVVCKKYVPTGSHMRKTICLPQSAWDQATADAKAISDEIREGGYR